MTKSSSLRLSLGWFMAGLILTTGLVNLFGFASPFYGHMTGSESRALLSVGQLVTPWFGVCFAVAFWILARAMKSAISAWHLRLLGVLLALSYAVPVLLDPGMPRDAAVFARGVFQFVALLAALVAVRATVSQGPTMR